MKEAPAQISRKRCYKLRKKKQKKQKEKSNKLHDPLERAVEKVWEITAVTARCTFPS
jgi:hypothetical protein